MKNSLARIGVQHAFCQSCAIEITKELQEISGIQNVYAYPEETLVVFQFERANNLSLVLNKLMDIGHPPVGDRIKEKNYVPPLCQCKGMQVSAA